MCINVCVCICDVSRIKSRLSLTGKDEIHSLSYHLIAGDLRNVEELNKKLLAAGIDQE